MTARTFQHVSMSFLIDEHLEYLESRGKSPRTREDREGLLRRLHKDLPRGIGFARAEQLVGWFAALARGGASAWTLWTYDMHARGFYAWADGRYLAGDPMASLGRPRCPRSRPDPVTEGELRLALERCSPWWRVAVLLGTLAGLRASEMAELRRDDITAEWIRIRRGKGGDPATVPTHPQLLELARAHPHEWMLPGPDGGHARPRRLPAAARPYFDSIGLPTVHLHRFRHYFATSLLRHGVDIRVVQVLMRHADIRSTQRYTLVVDEQRAAALRSLPPL